jgi:glycosyl transferase family 25
MRLNEFFDRVALINLDRRKDRLGRFDIQAISLGIEFVRYSAIDAEACGITGARACAASHRQVLADALADGVERLFIFEDDAGFDAEFNAKFSTLTERLPADWQMLYLGSWPYSIIDVGIEGIRKTHGNITTHAYGAKREIFQDLIDASMNQVNPIDAAYGLLHPRIVTYMAHPSMVTQMPDFSDIRGHEVDYRSMII